MFHRAASGFTPNNHRTNFPTTLSIVTYRLTIFKQALAGASRSSVW